MANNSQKWSWNAMCGSQGFHLWSPETHDMGLCFQYLCLQLPTLAILAVASAYFVGRQINHVQRTSYVLYFLNFRSVVVTLLALLPVMHVYCSLENDSEMSVIFYLSATVRCLAWLCHLGYTLALRNRLCLSARGPVFMSVLWTLLAVLSIISLRSESIIYKLDINPDREQHVDYSFSIVKVVLHVLYGLTLIPNEANSVYVEYDTSGQSPERQSLLNSSHAFVRFSEETDPNYLGVAMEETSWLSRIFFSWVNPMMVKGVQGKLNHVDDLYDLPDELNSNWLSQSFGEVLGCRESSNNFPDGGVGDEDVSLLRGLHKRFWPQFYGIGVLKLVADCCGFAGPMLLNKLVAFIEDRTEDVRLGYAFAFGLFLTTVIGSFCNAHFNFLMSVVGLKIRASLVTAIYKKTLSVGGTVLASAFSVGEIVNFMSTDTDRMVNACPSFHALWSIPFQISVTLYLLYRQVGLAFLAGVGFTVVLIPINRMIANKIGRLSAKMMEKKDGRVKMMTEILRGIKSIKLHVWEGHFIKIISKIREYELKYLRGRKYLDALCVYFWATTPVLISILTFTTYVLMGNKLTASTVFTSIALLNMLIGPLNAFPWVLNGLTEAWVSLKRIQKLIDLPDLDVGKYYDQTGGVDDARYSLVIEGAEFNWGKLLTQEERNRIHAIKKRLPKDKGKGKKSRSVVISEPTESADQPFDFYLHDINLRVRKGEFIGIMGPVGGGKSSLLTALLAELTKQTGRMSVSDLERGFGYVAQRPWLQRGTIRDNILFGKNYDEHKYTTVVQACGLMADLATLPAGDLSGVGDSGMTLSGGQKARICLARAVYQDKDVYLLDDIISAVDAHVAKHIFQHCIMGLLRNKTILLCTHHVRYLSQADRIIMMEHGSIIKQGKPNEVLDVEDMLPIDLELGDSSSLMESISLSESIKIEPSKADDDSILNVETHETGSVRAGVYGTYWKAIGHLLAISIFISMLLMQTSRNMTDWWLSYWVSNSEQNETAFFTTENLSSEQYLWVYCGLAAANSLFTLFRAFLFAYGGIRAASRIHKLLLRNIIKAKMTFFDITPLGRILNRFSSDTYTIDDSLPFILNILLAQSFGLLGAVIIILSGLPWLSLVLFPLVPIYNWLQNHYRLTSRELKRLSSVTLSPVYNHFNETLQGLSTIRAFRTTKRFKRDNEENVEMNQKAQFASQAAAQWLGLRLQFIGVAMVTGVGLLAVIQHQFDVANPGLVGLAISYALSVTGLLSGVVNAFTETEREMIAVERVNQYVEEVAPETSDFIMDPPYAWPSQGVVSFNNVFLKYREHLMPTLKGITFETRPAEKIGVVGRTGSGKSSLLTSLFRLVEIYHGSITVDSVNIAHISTAALRSRISCIPQEPFLYSGTVKENLDPMDEFRESEIWSALTRVDLTAAIKRMGGLHCPLTAQGDNLSAGQRQLFCLARALLHNAKILCIDEATANVDQATDRQIQQTLRSAFRKSTVITIAHRIQTVLDCDRVLVMSDGEIIEFDKPDALLADGNSLFYGLVHSE